MLSVLLVHDEVLRMIVPSVRSVDENFIGNKRRIDLELYALTV